MRPLGRPQSHSRSSRHRSKRRGLSSERLLRGPPHRIEGRGLPGPEFERLGGLMQQHVEARRSGSVQAPGGLEQRSGGWVLYQILYESGPPFAPPPSPEPPRKAPPTPPPPA